MKLMTRQIRTSLKNCHSDMQLTLEDDINVPDSKPDIEHIIKIQGEIHVQETSAETDRAIIRGQLSFSLLYLSDVDFRQIHTMQGQIPFEESIWKFTVIMIWRTAEPVSSTRARSAFVQS